MSDERTLDEKITGKSSCCDAAAEIKLAVMERMTSRSRTEEWQRDGRRGSLHHAMLPTLVGV